MPVEQPDRSREGVAELRLFSGVVNTRAPDLLSPGDLLSGRNVEINDVGQLERRRGHSPVRVAGSSHSLWTDGRRCFAVVAGSILEITRASPLATRTLVSLRFPEQPVSFTRAGSRYYWSNGTENGCVDGAGARTWGLPVPSFSLTATGGSLRAGRYTVAVTNARVDGQESGANTTTLEVSTGGIVIAPAGPMPADVVERNYYVSKWNSDQLYYAATSSAPSVVIGSEPTSGETCATLHLSPPPPGHAVAFFRGHVLVAKGDELRRSEPFAYELFDARKSLRYGERVTVVAPMDTGVYIGTETRLLWLSGKSPAEWEVETVVGNFGVPDGAWCYTRGDIFDRRRGAVKDDAVLFAASTGMFLGTDGGNVTTLTDDRYAIGRYTRGAVFVREHRGYQQALIALQGPTISANTFSEV